MSKLTHINENGDAQMVDVSDKNNTAREAKASAVVLMKAETLELIVSGSHKKGDVLAVARVAGIQAAKKCWELIPLCHPLMLSKVRIELTPNQEKSGKTILSDALAFQLHQRGLKTAYSKLSSIEEPNNTVNNEKSLSYLENSKYFKNIYLPPLITSDIDSIKKSANLAQKEIKKLEADRSSLRRGVTIVSSHPVCSPHKIEIAD